MHLLDRLQYKRRLRSQDLYDPETKPPPRPYLLALIFFLLPILTTALILWAVLQTWHLQLSPTPFHSHHHHHPSPLHSASPPNRWTNCGTTPSQAHARNCSFDILSFAWQTPECFDSDLLDAFIHYPERSSSSPPWQFYAHPNRTDETVDLTTALHGNRTLYVDWRYHVTHCVFMWRQMHRAYQVRGYIDSHVGSYQHTLHCQGVLIEAEGVGMGEVRVVAEVKYPDCWEVGTRGRDGAQGEEGGRDGMGRGGHGGYYAL